MTEKKEGYKDHRPNSRKGVIHELFDRQGPEVAWTRGVKMRLRENTLRSWLGQWRADDKKSKPKPAPKPKAKKAPKVKAKPEVKAEAAPEPKLNGGAEAVAA